MLIFHSRNDRPTGNCMRRRRIDPPNDRVSEKWAEEMSEEKKIVQCAGRPIRRSILLLYFTGWESLRQQLQPRDETFKLTWVNHSRALVLDLLTRRNWNESMSDVKPNCSGTKMASKRILFMSFNRERWLRTQFVVAEKYTLHAAVQSGKYHVLDSFKIRSISSRSRALYLHLLLLRHFSLVCVCFCFRHSIYLKHSFLFRMRTQV